MIYALWNGGHGSYRPSSLHDGDLETFDSVEAAADALIDRAENGHWRTQDFTFADGRTQSVLCPCVGDDCTMDVYLSNPIDDDGLVVNDPIPDLTIDLDHHRGGVRVHNYGSVSS